ncbi:MAG TPA: hypothetical protein VN577_05025 [Terriglobales bacterium]|nr:hypothetical protein [Terriglobales bacterium]
MRHLTATDIEAVVSKYFDIPSEVVSTVKVIRVDFAVDVGIPVSWFRTHAEVMYKQNSEMFPGWNEQRKRGVLTLQFGSHGDLYRIYDKTAQRIDRKEPLVYANMGTKPRPPIVTRIERQCIGRTVPKEVQTLGGLLSRAVELNPFVRLVLHSEHAEPMNEDWDAQKWICCLGLRAAVELLGGVPAVRKKLNDLGNGKAARYFRNYSDFLKKEPGVTSSQVGLLYKRSTLRQLFPFVAYDLGPSARVWTL